MLYLTLTYIAYLGLTDLISVVILQILNSFPRSRRLTAIHGQELVNYSIWWIFSAL